MEEASRPPSIHGAIHTVGMSALINPSEIQSDVDVEQVRKNVIAGGSGKIKPPDINKIRSRIRKIETQAKKSGPVIPKLNLKNTRNNRNNRNNRNSHNHNDDLFSEIGTVMSAGSARRIGETREDMVDTFINGVGTNALPTSRSNTARIGVDSPMSMTLPTHRSRLSISGASLLPSSRSYSHRSRDRRSHRRNRRNRRRTGYSHREERNEEITTEKARYLDLIASSRLSLSAHCTLDDIPRVDQSNSLTEIKNCYRLLYAKGARIRSQSTSESWLLMGAKFVEIYCDGTRGLFNSKFRPKCTGLSRLVKNDIEVARQIMQQPNPDDQLKPIKESYFGYMAGKFVTSVALQIADNVRKTGLTD